MGTLMTSSARLGGDYDWNLGIPGSRIKNPDPALTMMCIRTWAEPGGHYSSYPSALSSMGTPMITAVVSALPLASLASICRCEPDVAVAGTVWVAPSACFPMLAKSQHHDGQLKHWW